jgi:hypothetical protein
MGSRRSSHAIRQLSVTKDDSFEEEEESEPEEVILKFNSQYKYICKYKLCLRNRDIKRSTVGQVGMSFQRLIRARSR